MRTCAKRGLSLLLALVMCVSLLSGLVFTGTAATVTYKTGNADGFSNVILNWGSRGTLATFLSPNAIDFYQDNHTSYAELSALSGSSNTSSVPNSPLYKELAELMKDNHKIITTYNQTRDLYRFTDCQNSSNTAKGSISSFYTGIGIGPDWDGGATWNREHTWPNSKGLNGSDENDIMMLRPTSKSENSARGNKAYGESSSYFNPDSDSNGKYHLRGDVARTMLYVYVRWGNTNLWGTDGVIENKEILLKWMKEDPVDTWELGRNDSVESITGTRNVFVDYPELVFVLFGEEIPVMDTPSGEAAKGGFTITATSSNSAHGTVSVNGKNINATPADGYIISGYTLLSGDATVTRDGNVFTVIASSDCEIQINFVARTTGTVCFSEDGTIASTSTVYVDDGIMMPSHSGTPAAGYTFLGWVTAPVDQTTAAPASILRAGQQYIVTGDVTFYALYSRVDSNGSGLSSVYEAYTGLPVEGDYLIVSDGGAMEAVVSDKGRFDYKDVIITDNTIMNPSASIIWHIAPAGNYFTVYNEGVGMYAGGSGAASKGKLLDSVTDYAKWSISADQVFENYGNKTKGVTYTLRRNSNFGFACYSPSTGSGITLYKMSNGTVYYSTSCATCEHIHTAEVPEQLPDCTNYGYSAGVYCEDCKSYISGHELQAALGHDYDSVVTEPTATEQGYTTYTCTVCGDSYVDDYVDALGEQFRVSFVVPRGVTPVAGMDCGKAGITLPTAGVPTGEYEYYFVGWVTQQVDNSDSKPGYYPAGSTFNTDSAVTLYALYSYAPEGMGSGEWKLVTDAADLTSGAELVLASNVKSTVAGSLNSKYLTSVGAVFSNDYSTITTLPEDAVIFTLGGTAGQWTLTNASAQQLGGVAVKNVNWDTGVTTWSITVDEDFNATIQNTTAANGRFLYNVNSPRFLTYTSNTNTSMLLPQLYMLDGAAGTVYYTTVFENDDDGSYVSGTVESAATEGDVTVELLQGDSVVYTTTAADGAYVFTDVADGSYTLRVSKANHIARTYEITVASADVSQDAEICLIGDVNGDGKVNMKDWNVMYEHVSEKTPLTDYRYECGDVNSDGKVNMKDWNRLYDHVSETNPLW